jgi:acetolactate synthase-1/2/3 large subunit
MMAPITKMTRQIVSADSIAALTREAFRTAVQEKAGPVHLELPEDIAADLVSESAKPFPVSDIPSPFAAEKTLAHVAAIISQAENPLLLIAAAANRHQTGPALEKFIERTGIHFFSTQMGKGTADEFHARCLGTAALSDHDYLHCAIAKADVIINVGHDVVEKPPFFMRRDGVRVIHINYFSAVFDEVYFPQHEVIGDIADSVERLGDLIAPDSLAGNGYFSLLKKEIDKNVYQRNLPLAFPYTPQQLTKVLRELLGKDTILSLDNGMYKIWFARNYRSTDSCSLLLDNALATMGAGLPVAIAAKMLFPERKVVAVCGDGGFMMNSQELETAIRLKLDLTILLLRDDGLGMIKWKQAGMGLPDFGLDFGNPDFVKYAESYGAQGWRVSEKHQLAEILPHCLADKGVHLIELPVDYAETESVLIEELRRKTCLIG